MFSQVGCDYVFEHFAQNTYEWNRAIIDLTDLSPFLKMGDTFASFQIWESFPESSDFWKITCNIGASSAWRVCRTMGLNWSGPAALWGFRDLSSFSMPFTEICISGIWLYMGWIGKVSCIPGHLALEVFDELRSLSVRGIWGWKQTGIVCIGHLISHSRQRGSFLPTSMGLHHLGLVLWVFE